MSEERTPVDEMLCRWAERKYELAAVTRVEFAFEDDGDWSEVTPGDGPYMSVTVTYGDGAMTHRAETYDTALIREVLAFALGGPDA